LGLVSYLFPPSSFGFVQVCIFDLVIRVFFAQSTFAMFETKVFVLESVDIVDETVSEVNMNPTNNLLDVENVHP